jgi:hypothetical protein
MQRLAASVCIGYDDDDLSNGFFDCTEDFSHVFNENLSQEKLDSAILRGQKVLEG